MKLTPEKLVAFCAALAKTGIVRRACEAVDISRALAYKWRADMPEFAEAWDKAMAIGVTAWEDSARTRAFEGVEEPVFKDGVQVGKVQKYSDTLAIFLLKAHDPKYRDHSRVDIQGNLSLSSMSDDDIKAELAALAASGAVPQIAPTESPDDGEELI